MVRPSTWAVLRLRTNSNCMGRCTGKSALQNCSCDRTSFGGPAGSSDFPFYIWHWQYARKMASLRGHGAPTNRKYYRCS
jgi:hypothetical protein